MPSTGCLTPGAGSTARPSAAARSRVITAANLPGRDHALRVDQALAVEQVATSGRALDVLVGPAGTGKTTTLAGLRAVWEAEHGAGSVVGPRAVGGRRRGPGRRAWDLDREHREVAVRAPAAGRDDAPRSTSCSTTQSTPSSPRRRGSGVEQLRAELAQWSLRKDQLVIVDESSMAGTFVLEELATAAQQAGAKLLLVGDPYQLSAVEAGGMFAALVRDRDDGAPELEGVHRFHQPVGEGRIAAAPGRPCRTWSRSTSATAA